MPDPKQTTDELFDMLERGIDAIPGGAGRKLRDDLAKLRGFFVDRRPPRIMLVGRRGSGKSSLLNAVFAQQVADVGSVLAQTATATWHSLSNERGTLRILDTRGLGDHTKPEASRFDEAIDEISDAVRQECPDVILFLCKAKEVDANIKHDLEGVGELLSLIRSVHGYDAPLAAVVTQVDELDPKREEPPYASEAKQRHILAATRQVDKALRQAGVQSMKVLPVSAYAEYGPTGEREYDNYWNIDKLVEYLTDTVPSSAQIELARLGRLRRVQLRMSAVLVNTTATLCASIAATPIPMADAIPMTGAQILMIRGIAHIGGHDLAARNAHKFLVALGLNIGSALAMRELARALLKTVFPGGGNVVSAGVAALATKALGVAAETYFIRGESIDTAKKRFREVKARGLKHDDDTQIEP